MQPILTGSCMEVLRRALALCLAACLLFVAQGGPDLADPAPQPGTSHRLQARNAGERIVGGTVAPVGRYPYQALMLKNGYFACGGALILDRVVLTAAHCVHQSNPSIIKIQLGVHSRSSGSFEEIGVDSVIVHSGYNDKTYINDIALLYLSKAATNTSYLKLSSSKEVYTSGQALRVIGWGTTAPGGYTSDVLRQVDVPIVATSTCNGKSSYKGEVLSTMFCAGPMAGGKDSCQGDSGGPIFKAGARSADDVSYGIVSWGYGCAARNLPGIYTSTAVMRPWIDSQLTALGYTVTDTCPACQGLPCRACSNPLVGCVNANEGGVCKPQLGDTGTCQSGSCVAKCPASCGPCAECTDPEVGCVAINEGGSCTLPAGGKGTCTAEVCSGSEIDLVGKVAAQASNRTTTPGFEASRAINGNFNDMSSTRVQTNPWWWVDLGSSQAVKSVTLFLRTADGTYCYTSSTSKSLQAPRAETLRVTVGDGIPTPSTSTGDIKNTIVFDNIVDMSVQGVTLSFSQGSSSYMGRYVALQIRGANKYLDMVEVRLNVEPDPSLFKATRKVEGWF